MSATLTAPLAQASIAQLKISQVTLNLDALSAVISYDQLDGSGNAIGPSTMFVMTLAAFRAAYGAAAGANDKAKIYNVLLGQLGLTASSIT